MIRKFFSFLLVLAAIFLMAEAGLRLLLAFNIHAFRGLRNPANFADRDNHEDFHKLYARWYGDLTRSPERTHAEMGWSQVAVTPENPLGLEQRTLDLIPPDGKPHFLFYGDSFVKGSASPDFYIPRYMNRQMPEADIVDLSIGGGGPDQMLLMFRRTWEKFDKPVVIVGMLMEDVDRAALKVFYNPKPYFEISREGGLVLKGVPVPRDPKKYFRDNPPEIKSYLLRFFRAKTGNLPKRTELKKQINAKIIEEFQRTCSEKGIPLIYVLFYGKKQLGFVDWREAYLKGELEKRAIPYFDSKPALLEYSRAHAVDIGEFYSANPGDGHHLDLGNQVIAEALVEYLKKNGYYPSHD